MQRACHALSAYWQMHVSFQDLNVQDGAAMIKMEDLKAEAQEEIKKGEGSARPAGMYI
jgi:hypothetical protein